MKKIASVLAGGMLSLALGLSAYAHDGWSQTNRAVAEPGEPVYVELLYGNHSNHHASYRVDGKWSMDNTIAYVTTPGGVKADITSTAFYTGELTDVTEARLGVNNSYIVSFSASTPGPYIVSVEGDSVFRSGETASRTLRSAKSFSAVADIPTVQRASSLTGFSKTVSPDRAELVPLFNPAAALPDTPVSVQLLLKGEPLAATEVSLIRRSTSDSQTMVTDEDGMIRFLTGPADYYLLRAKPVTDEKVEGDYDSTNYEATMTFMVQNGRNMLPAEPEDWTPYIHVNGSLQHPDSVELREGSVWVPADWIREHVDGSYAGSGMAPLRGAVEAAGAGVEYLPAVGAVRPAVHLYVSAN